MKKVYLLPNFVTTANLFCGFYSIVSSIHSDFITAAWAIVAAGVLDLLDGRIARMAKATSAFGVEYDSLSDLVSFGLSPALLVYQWALAPYDRLGWMVAFLFVLCGALRLARFNVKASVPAYGYFEGLPIPIAAGLMTTFVLFADAIHLQELQDLQDPQTLKEGIVLTLLFLLSSLMVSTLPFPSFKELNWRARVHFGHLLLGLLTLILIAVKPEMTLFLLLGFYLVASLLWNLKQCLWTRRLLGRFSKPKDSV